MNPKRWSLLLLLVAVLVAGFYTARFVMAVGFGKFPVVKLRSDVPVTTEIGWWNNDDCMTVTEFEATAVGHIARYGLNTKEPFAIEYHIVGTLQRKGTLRPYIDSVFISDRLSDLENGYRDVDVLVHPRIGIRKDESYNGEPIPFDIRVQRNYRTFQWGQNEYHARCEGHHSTATVHQYK